MIMKFLSVCVCVCVCVCVYYTFLLSFGPKYSPQLFVHISLNLYQSIFHILKME
jgi:hypothetical protein